LESVLKSYREKDTAIKNAIVNAQIAADNIIKNAEFQANDIKASAVSQMTNFASTIQTQKTLIKEFQDDYNYLIQKYVHDFQENEFIKLYEKLNQIEEYFNTLKSPVYKTAVLMEDED
jgi:hypothetical protein